MEVSIRRGPTCTQAKISMFKDIKGQVIFANPDITINHLLRFHLLSVSGSEGRIPCTVVAPTSSSGFRAQDFPILVVSRTE